MKVSADRDINSYRLHDQAVADPRETGAIKPAAGDGETIFTRVVGNHAAKRQGDSLSARLSQVASPTVEDPALFSGERTIELLQYVADQVLPVMKSELEGGSDIADLAIQLINEEIGMRLEWEMRRSDEHGEEQEA
ncbi:hypothetical protein [Halomonas binhaiensis]|uniref:Uncharacterized protein n=1 Tax=Halomonas binhaiensis TaxID=2562282 RepID=A0A5C1NJR2_9GAMM|nr:hypothetical protein [Halomonas binhaiensis]QEM82567.1 hypothetical protein E4T21_14190 [Halomonas binhaiensis]